MKSLASENDTYAIFGMPNFEIVRNDFTKHCNICN